MWVYDQRRKNLKERQMKLNEQHARLTSKIRTFRAAMRRIDKRCDRIRRLDGVIKDFFGSSIRELRDVPTKEATLAKRIFCKYGLEHGITGTYLSEYMGAKSPQYASQCRFKLTRSFKDRPEDKEMYHRLLAYAKENLEAIR